MADQYTDDTQNGSGVYPTRIPDYADAADIQQALRLYHYGSATIPTENVLGSVPNGINTKSIAGYLKSLSNTIATEVTDRTAADTNLQTQVTNLLNTINLQTTVTTRSSSFTLSLSDAGKTILLDTASTMTLTVPTNSSVEIPIGYQYFVIETGVGRTTFTPASGVTINSKNSQMYIDTQYGKATLLKVGTNSWIAYGDIYENVASVPTPVAVPVTPAPVTPPFFPPAPVTPAPVTPAPVTPAPVTPAPVTPAPVTPAPVTPAPVTPAPVATPVALTYCISLGYNVPTSGYPGNCPGASPVAAPVSQYEPLWVAKGCSDMVYVVSDLKSTEAAAIEDLNATYPNVTNVQTQYLESEDETIISINCNPTNAFVINYWLTEPTSIQASWSNAPAFTVSYETSINGGSVSNISSTSRTFTGLQPSTSYTILVIAKDSNFQTLASDTLTVTTPSAAPVTTPVAAPVASASAYWYTGCCSTTGQQVTGQSSSDFAAAFNSMNSQCSGEVTNTSSGNFGTIPTISCVATPVATPVTPAPVTPAPVTPAPVTPAPVTPAPVTPAPVTPAPVTPAPVTPAPVTPAPVTPAPVVTYCRNEVRSISNATCPTGNATYNVCYSNSDYTGQISSTFISCIGSPAPAPVTPAPVTPAPVTPAPVTPAPVTPAPVTPAPVTPAPVTPAPVTGTPVAQTYCPSLGYNVPSSGYPGNCPGYRFDANTINI
jgi:hypothetical protein